MTNAWRGFRGDHWRDDVNVRDFVQQSLPIGFVVVARGQVARHSFLDAALPGVGHAHAD